MRYLSVLIRHFTFIVVELKNKNTIYNSCILFSCWKNIFKLNVVFKLILPSLSIYYPKPQCQLEGTASSGIPQAITIYNSLSTTACTSVDTFAIVHELFYRVDGCAGSTKFATILTLCSSRRSSDTFPRLSLCGAILKYTTITNLFLQFHSNKASRWWWIKLPKQPEL